MHLDWIDLKDDYPVPEMSHSMGMSAFDRWQGTNLTLCYWNASDTDKDT